MTKIQTVLSFEISIYMYSNTTLSTLNRDNVKLAYYYILSLPKQFVNKFQMRKRCSIIMCIVTVKVV